MTGFTEEQVIFLVLLAFVWLLAALSFSAIWIYISSKAPGMQTLNDCMTKDLVLATIVAYAGATATTLDYGKIPPWLARFLICFQFFAVMGWSAQVFLVVAVRYLSVFHSHVIMELDEAKFKVKSRAFICLMSLTCTVFEMAYSNLAFGPLYEYLVTGDVSQLELEQPMKVYSIRIVIVLDILLMIKLQVRLESLNRQHEQVNETYGFGTIRFVIICSVMALAGMWLSLYSYSARRSSQIRVVFFGFIILNIVPIIFIIRNEKMTRYLASKLALWIVNMVAPNLVNDIA